MPSGGQERQMRTVAIAGIVHQLRRRLAGAPSDADLLDAFVARRDDAAFAELVHRHGPKVYAVCRRVLGRHHLAEDAYQATFVVLARKAHRVRPRSAVGGFLYGVARKAALEAYAVSRRRKEALVARVPDVPVSAAPRADPDALAALDEEIANLSDALRAAVVLCELDGVGRAEAARQLGIPEGTLSSRLAAARRRLATKLKARGVFGLAVPLAALAASASAAPPALKVASPTVSAIARGVFRTMLFTTLKTAAPACAAVVALTLGALTPARLPGAAKGPDPSGRSPVPAVTAAAPAPVPNAEPRESTFVVGCTNNSKPGEVVALVAPDGTAHGFVAVGKLKIVMNPRVSPDGKRLAFLWKRPYAGKPADTARTRSILDLYVADIGAKEAPTEPIVKDVIVASFAWAPDSKKLYVSSLPEEQFINELAGQIVPIGGQTLAVKTRLFDLASKKETPLDIPEGHGVCDVTRDGKTLLTRKIVQYPSYLESMTSYLVPLATLTPKAITADEEGLDHARFSPDGKRVAGVRKQYTKSKEKGLFIYDIATERLAPVALPKDIPPQKLEQVAWAPDGKRLAVLWRAEAPGGPGAVGGPPGVPAVRGNGHPIHRITSFDPTGENAKLVQEFKARPFDYMVWGFDWADLVRPGIAPGE
jgi:RNA polymerase sigma factor (sigma-70 family)